MADEQKPQTINEEAGLPDNWIPVDAPPLIPSLIVPTADGSSKYLQGSLPPGFQHDVSFTGTAYRQDRTPQLSLMPLGIQGSPASNAAIQSTSTKVTQEVIAAAPPSTGGGGVTSVGLDLPSQFTVTNSPVTSAGTLTAAWAGEQPSTFFGAAGPGLSGLQEDITGVGTSASGGANIFLTATPATPTSFGLFFTCTNLLGSTPAGWTAFTHSTGSFLAAYTSITGTSPISPSSSSGSGSFINWAANLVLFNGPAPAVAQTAVGNAKSGTVSFGANTVAGNTIIVVMSYQESGANSNFGMIFSDSQKNSFTQIGRAVIGSSGSYPACQQTVWIATGIVGGADTFTVNYSGRQVGVPIFNFLIIELGPIAAGSNIPFFRVLSPADIPTINLGISGNGGVGGILPVLNGGTGSDLSATGGASQFLSQSTSGGVITPIQPDFSDLAGATGKLATKYNGVILVSNGLPSEIVKVDLVTQSAAITATTLISAPQTGMYRISWSSTITTPDGVSSTLGGTNGFQIIYTSPTDSVVKTTVPQAPWSTGGNTTGTADGGVAVIYAKTGTNIQYTYGYTSATPGQMVYELHIKLESL